MRRRDFIEIVTALAATWPLATRAQPTNKIARIGFLVSATAAGSSQSVRALREGLKALGYIEGKNIIIEFRWAEGKYERLTTR
jgi:putative ABC transport system substrate-binding protein